MNIDRALLLLDDIRVEYSTMDSLKEYVEAIDLITQELKTAHRNNELKDGYLELIHGVSYDYDGRNTVPSLKKLINEIDSVVVKALKNDDKTIIYLTDADKNIGKNVLFEEIKGENNG